MPLLAKILLASFASGMLGLAGGLFLLAKSGWVRQFTIHLISFAVGALLAVSFLDLLPEAFASAGEENTDPKSIFLAALAGIVAFFILERLVFRYHPHHHGEEQGLRPEDHHHAAPTMLMVGDTIHNFIDGVVVAVTFIAQPTLGILTAIAVAAHEIPQEVGDFSVMLYHGWPPKKILWANIFSALASVLGSGLAFVARDFVTAALPQLLAFTAGVFIYIATTDLIPDLSHKAGRDKVWHVIGLLLLGVLTVGVLGMYLKG